MLEMRVRMSMGTGMRELGGRVEWLFVGVKGGGGGV